MVTANAAPHPPGPVTAPYGIILAGGRARRMGGADKALVPFGPDTLLDRIIARFAPQVPALALSANGDPARFARFGLSVLPDDPPLNAGPLAGILAGMERAAAEGHDRIVTVPADTPFLPCDLVVRLILAAELAGVGAAVAATDRTHPVCGLWPVAARGLLRDMLARGEHRVGTFAASQQAATATFPATFPDASPDPFFNVNTPEDLARAVAHAQPSPRPEPR